MSDFDQSIVVDVKSILSVVQVVSKLAEMHRVMWCVHYESESFREN
jgi:hypothetical protein